MMLNSITFSPTLLQTTAIARTDASAIKAQLVLQVTAPVLFDACARRVRESVAPSSMVELGPGRVLTGLVDTIYRECAEASVASDAALTGAAKQESDAAKHALAVADKAAAVDRSPLDQAVAAAASRATIGTADELTVFVKNFGV